MATPRGPSAAFAHPALEGLSAAAAAKETALEALGPSEASDEANAAQSGYALFAVQPSKQEHVPYSLDYHALAKVDDKLFSEH